MANSDNFISFSQTATDALHSVTTSESKQNLNQTTETTNAATPATTVTPHSLNAGNHLELPSNNNPNLLSPDILNQRRGMFITIKNRNFISILNRN